MDVVTRKHLNILIQLAEADKHFAKAERDMIFKIARERNFPETEVQELIRKPEPIDSLGALSVDQKFEYLYSSIELILVDQNIFESEIIFCKSLAIKLGFKKAIIEYFLENVNKKSKTHLKEIAISEYL
ncbi:MAG: TerB family tellurite resistance protein [Cytophagia bacterium]|nr:TerB family tellurite resistance protein [Cytophagia bacterium]